MGDLNTQLRSYYQYVGDTQEPVEMADIFNVGEPVRPIAHPVDPPDRRWLRVGMIVAGAAAAVFAVLLIPIMLRSDAPPPIEEITEPTATSTTVIEELTIQWIETQTTELVLPFAPTVAPQGAECPAPGATPPGGAGTTEGVWHDDTCYFLADHEVLYRSADGVQWEAAATSGLLGSISINSEGFSSIRVVDEAGALDPSNCNVGDTDMEIGQSTDGESWTITKLPLERPSGESECLEVEWPHLAIGPAGTFVTADIFYGLETQFVVGWWSPDGSQWSTAAREGPMRNGHISFVEAVDDGFIVESEGLFSEDAQEGIVWFTSDGTAWTRRSDTGDTGDAAPIAPLATTTGFGTLVWTESDTVLIDGVETPVSGLDYDDLGPRVADNNVASAIDEATKTALIAEYVPDLGDLVVQAYMNQAITNGRSTVIPVHQLMGLDPAAIGLSESQALEWAATPNGFEVSDEDGVNVRARIEKRVDTADVIDESTGKVFATLRGSDSLPIDLVIEIAKNGPGRQGALLVSQDGVSWTYMLVPFDEDFAWGFPITALPGGSFVLHTSAYRELGPPQATLFTSEDGLTWLDRGDPEFLSDVDNHMGVDIFPFADHLQATVTLRDSDSPGSWESWESEDGISWKKSTAGLWRTTRRAETIRTDAGWIAFVPVAPSTERVGIWVSLDGDEWTQMTAPDQYMTVEAGPSSYSIADNTIRLAIFDHETGDLLSWIGHFES